MSQDPILRHFELLVRRRPTAALVCSPKRVVTIAEIDALARAVAHRLSERRLAPDAIVALAAGNGPAFLAAFIALRRAQLVALLLDARSPRAEGLRIAGALGAGGCLLCRDGWPRDDSGWEWIDVAREAPNAAPRHLPGIAVVKLTSGSTGAPRGIATPVEALAADDAALALTMGLRPDDRLLATVPMSHSYGLSSLVLPALVRGSLLVVPEESCLFAPFTAAARTGATVFPTAPAYLDALLRVSQAPPWPESLRLVLSAGAPLNPCTASRFREAFGQQVHVFYGASECGGICFDREGGAGERGSVGTPVEGVRVTLLDVEGGEEGPTGAHGSERSDGVAVVTVDSPSVAAGYLPDGEPSRLGAGRFVAGDLAAWSHGELVLRGRQDGLINIKGRKVNPREVEGVLEQLEGVEDVVVLGVPVPERAGEVLRAVVACRPGRLTPEQVLAWCRSHLSAHKVPRSLILVPRVPRTSRGKVDRPALLSLRSGAEEGKS